MSHRRWIPLGIVAGLLVDAGDVLAAEATMDDIVRAAQLGVSEETMQRVVDSRAAWDVDGETAVLLLRAGVSEAAVRRMSAGAHPTPEEVARAGEPGPAYRPAPTELHASRWKLLRDRPVALTTSDGRVVRGLLLGVTSRDVAVEAEGGAVAVVPRSEVVGVVLEGVDPNLEPATAPAPEPRSEATAPLPPPPRAPDTSWRTTYVIATAFGLSGLAQAGLGVLGGADDPGESRVYGDSVSLGSAAAFTGVGVAAVSGMVASQAAHAGGADTTYLPAIVSLGLLTVSVLPVYDDAPLAQDLVYAGAVAAAIAQIGANASARQGLQVGAAPVEGGGTLAVAGRF